MTRRTSRKRKAKTYSKYEEWLLQRDPHFRPSGIHPLDDNKKSKITFKKLIKNMQNLNFTTGIILLLTALYIVLCTVASMMTGDSVFQIIAYQGLNYYLSLLSAVGFAAIGIYFLDKVKSK